VIVKAAKEQSNDRVTATLRTVFVVTAKPSTLKEKPFIISQFTSFKLRTSQ